jgi:hypothetical protein
MEVSSTSFRGLAAGLLILLASVSAAVVMAADKDKSSGFLDPAIEAKLKDSKLPDGRKFIRWRSPQLTRDNYQSIMVDRVIFYPSPHPGPQISSSTLEAIGDHLTYTLRQKIGAKVPVVDKAGPGVLRLQAAITAVTAETEGMTPVDVLPVMLVFSAASSAAGTKAKDVNARVEMRVTDSVSGDYRAAGVMKLEGKQLEGKKDNLQLQDLQQALDLAAGDSAHALEDALAD